MFHVCFYLFVLYSLDIGRALGFGSVYVLKWGNSSVCAAPHFFLLGYGI